MEKNNNEKKKIKNGKIELLRFIFAITILIYHINLKVFNLSINIGPFSIARRGYLGVEFFFLVSGFLLAKQIFKEVERERISDNVADDTVHFMKNRIKGFFSYHLIVCFIMCIVVCLLAPSEIPYKLFSKLPSIFLIQNTGILGSTNPLIAMEWYISSMVIAMAIIYPLARNHYKMVTNIIGPIFSLFLLGYMIKTTGSIGGTKEMLGFTLKCNYRALAEILIGMSCFEVSRFLTNQKLSKLKVNLLHFVEIICYTLSFLYIFSNLNARYEFHLLMLLALAITITFTDFKSSSSKIFNNKFIYYLGTLSLPIYLTQEIVWELILYYMPSYGSKFLAMIIFVITMIASILLQFLVNKIKRYKETSKFAKYNITA